MLKVLLLAVTLLVGSLGFGEIPDAPKPKHEVIKFSLASAGFAASAAFQVWAQHEGARQCVAEDNRAGVGRLFDTSGAYGHRPVDSRVYTIDGAVLGTAIVLEVAGHRKVAKYLLMFATASQASVASATYWYGCN